MSEPMIEVRGLNKTYDSGFTALKNIDLTVRKGEIFALLGPNGAGKTTLINIICGIVNPGQGTVMAGGHDVIEHFRAARRLIGLVPQELTVEPFARVQASLAFSRGLFGKPRNDGYIEQLLKDLSLWDKRKNMTRELSGGMKRRVMIAKALAHEPDILFLDEPTAGVDVELRRSMWQVVRKLRQRDVTIVLTTHYLEEAEQMADRIGIINRGEIGLVEDKSTLMRKMGEKRLVFQLARPMAAIPESLAGCGLSLDGEGQQLVHLYHGDSQSSDVQALFKKLEMAGIAYTDVDTRKSSLEEIFVNLMRDGR